MRVQKIYIKRIILTPHVGRLACEGDVFMSSGCEGDVQMCRGVCHVLMCSGFEGDVQMCKGVCVHV